MELRISRQDLDNIARAHGMELLGVLTLPATLSDDAAKLQVWQRSGFAGDMQYMNRDGGLLAEPQRLAPHALTLVSFAAYYDRGSPPARLPEAHGRVARYAWGRDYHRVLKKALRGIVARVEALLNRSIEARIFSDAVPLLERAVARTVGGGFVGKNTMLIQPRGRGSFFFLAEVIWNVAVEETPARDRPSPEGGGCGTCRRCLVACPTKAFSAEYVLDARKCISYLTIEKRGVLNRTERVQVGEWVFGCDICQEVCPFNHQALERQDRAPIEALGAHYGVGATLSLREILSIRRKEDFLSRFAGTALMRTNREGLVRNAAAVAANRFSIELSDCLMEAATKDESPVVRAQALGAVEALARLSGSRMGKKVAQIIESAETDSNPIVREEAVLCRQSLES